MHILHAISTDIIDVDIEHVSPLADLLPTQGNKAIPIFIVEEGTAFFRAAGIEALTNNQKRIFLVVGLGAVNGGRRGYTMRLAGFGAQGLHTINKGFDMGGAGTTATANDIDTQIFDKALEILLHLVRR